MPSGDPCILLTADAAAKIASSTETHGRLALRYAAAEDLFVVASVETGRGVLYPADISRRYTTLHHWGDSYRAARWVRPSTVTTNFTHWYMARRPGTVMSWPDFRALVPQVGDPGAISGVVITHDSAVPPDLRKVGVCEFAGWLTNRDGVQPMHVEVEPPVIGLRQLIGKWPVERLRTNSVMVVGCGSIGSAAIDALAGFGIGQLVLVDPDRFLWHNIIRHTLNSTSVGRYKVSALKDHLADRWPELDVHACRLDAVDDAHHLRPLVDQVDLVICAADGIAPRRVVSHLARRARKPAVLACVLDNGAVGEVLRLRPTARFGCLLCVRARLAANGALDAEADQELDYGTGHVHRPMVAVPPDLHLVGSFAGKVGTATLLESLHGDHTQRLPGEHAIIGLRPGGDLAAPFDLADPTQVRWGPIDPPRSVCPTCSGGP